MARGGRAGLACRWALESPGGLAKHSLRQTTLISGLKTFQSLVIWSAVSCELSQPVYPSDQAKACTVVVAEPRSPRSAVCLAHAYPSQRSRMMRLASACLPLSGRLSRRNAPSCYSILRCLPPTHEMIPSDDSHSSNLRKSVGSTRTSTPWMLPRRQSSLLACRSWRAMFHFTPHHSVKIVFPPSPVSISSVRLSFSKATASARLHLPNHIARLLGTSRPALGDVPASAG